MTSSLPVLLVVHAAATWFMAGVIWFVQLVHYPLFMRVDVTSFDAYQRANTARTTWVVLPPMLAEIVTAALLLLRSPPGVPVGEAWAGVAMVAVIWLSTLLVQSPIHGRLQESLDARWARRLVRTNWLRTVLWTARAALVSSWLLRPAG